MKTLAIHGGNGNHAKDIINRGVFSDFNIQIVEMGDVIPFAGIDAHMVFLPIEATRKRIEEIHTLSPSTPILNFSGIQGTSPSHLIREGVVSNIHFLFGPNMTGDKLKASIASTKIHDITTQVLLRVSELGIKVLEHSHEEHDEKVAITQGFSHALFLSMSEAHILPPPLFERWKAVPAGTSGGMIHFNTFYVERLIFKFMSLIEGGVRFRDAFTQIVENGKIDEFTTPNFERIYNAILGLNGSETNISEEILESKKEEIIHHLWGIVTCDQDELVDLIQKTRNGEIE